MLVMSDDEGKHQTRDVVLHAGKLGDLQRAGMCRISKTATGLGTCN